MHHNIIQHRNTFTVDQHAQTITAVTPCCNQRSTVSIFDHGEHHALTQLTRFLDDHQCTEVHFRADHFRGDNDDDNLDKP